MARVRGAAFVALFYALMGLWGLIGAPAVLWREGWARAWMKAHNRIAFALLGAICGLRVEVRGAVPAGPCVVAAKHQSLLDVLVLFNALPEPRFVMKRELLRAPVFGLFARRAGAVPVDRAGGAGAVRGLVAAFRARGGQIVVYPQGTRTPPGAGPAEYPYRRGAAVIAAELGLPVVLATTNAGLFWPRRGVARHPGRAVVWLFGRIEPGLPVPDLAREIEARIEAATGRLADGDGVAPPSLGEAR